MRLRRAAILLACALGLGATTVENSFQNVVVKPGETMWAIARKWLKDPTKWDELLKYNKLPTPDPTVALPGMTLRVPVRLIKTHLRAAHLAYAVNQVLFRPHETAEWKSCRVSQELFQGDSLRTGEDSKARVKLLDKELLSLEPNSMAVVKPTDGEADLVLKAGAVFAGRARVVTSNASVTPKTRDTRYSARVEPDLTTKVEVFSGKAQVDAQGSSVLVPAGMGTQVRPGLAPELPRRIENLPELEARAVEYASAVEAGGGTAPNPRGKPEALPTPEADADSLRGDLKSLSVGMPILGYRVQAARDRDFRDKVLDKRYDSDERLNPGSEGLAPGAYWWRVAVIDLLGTEGRFTEARYYSVGVKRAAPPPTVDLRKAVIIAAPPEDAVVQGDKVRVVGMLRDDRLKVDVNGKLVRPDADGNFVVELPLEFGRTEILVNVSDAAGNKSSFSRRVTRGR